MPSNRIEKMIGCVICFIKYGNVFPSCSLYVTGLAKPTVTSLKAVSSGLSVLSALIIEKGMLKLFFFQ